MIANRSQQANKPKRCNIEYTCEIQSVSVFLLAADIQRIHAQVNADINVQIQKQKTHIAMHQVRTH